MTAYDQRVSDGSSDLCSSDLPHLHREGGVLSQRRRLTFSGLRHRCAPSRSNAQTFTEQTMKIRNSLKSLKNRHRDTRVIRRRGRTRSEARRVGKEGVRPCRSRWKPDTNTRQSNQNKKT